jgi:hypothetical protein
LRIGLEVAFLSEYTRAENHSKGLSSHPLIDQTLQSSSNNIYSLAKAREMRGLEHHHKVTERHHLSKRVSLRRKISNKTEYKTISNNNSSVMMTRWFLSVEQLSVMIRKSVRINPISHLPIDISSQSKLGRRLHNSCRILCSFKQTNR